MIFTGSPTFTIPILVVEISFYRLFLIVALCVTVATATWLIKKSNLDFKRACLTLLTSALAFFAGARLFNLAIRVDLYLEQPWRLWSLDTSDFSLYGGILAAIVAAILMSRFLRLDVWRFGDATAPAFGSGLAVMRIGCYLNGCCFGRPTDLPWGTAYPLFGDTHLWQMAHGLTDPFTVLPVHPTQIYELAYSLVGAALAYWIWRKKTTPGVAVLAFAVWLTTLRLFNHYLRALAYDDAITQIGYPAMYLVILIMGAFLLYKKSRGDIRCNTE